MSRAYTTNRQTLAALVFAGAFVFSGCANNPDRTWLMPRLTPRVSDATPRADYNRTVFDHVCKLTGIYFYDATFGGHDWPAIQEKYRPEAIAAKNNEALYETLNAMLKELGSSHATAVAPEVAGIQKRMGDEAVSLLGYISIKLPDLDTPVVYEVAPNSPASNAGVKRGWLVAGDLMRDSPDLPVHEGEVVRQQFRDEHDVLRTVTLTLRAVRGLGTKKIAALRPDGVLCLRFDRFDEESAAWVREQLKILAISARGVVLDLRLNGGGQVAACRRILGEFFMEPVMVGEFVDRREKAAVVETNISRRSAHYTGPLAVLVARMSGSGAEVFAAAIQDTKRGAIVGSTSTGRTAGAVLMSVDFSLPGGGRLQLPLRNYKTAAGVLLEGCGVRADVDAPLPTVESLRAGEDPALECAAGVLRQRPDGLL